MNIQGPSNIHGVQNVKGPHSPHRSNGAKQGTSATGAGDQLDISPAAEAAAQAAESGEIRSELVARVRSEIAQGTYETPEKLGIALSTLLDEVS